MIPKTIVKDIANIKSELDDELEKVAFFGSILKKPFEQINDVDVVLFIKPNTHITVKNKLLKLALTLPVTPQKINGCYIKIDKVRTEKDYHVILMEADNPNETFMAMNKNGLQYI